MCLNILICVLFLAMWDLLFRKYQDYFLFFCWEDYFIFLYHHNSHLFSFNFNTSLQFSPFTPSSSKSWWSHKTLPPSSSHHFFTEIITLSLLILHLNPQNILYAVWSGIDLSYETFEITDDCLCFVPFFCLWGFLVDELSLIWVK